MSEESDQTFVGMKTLRWLAPVDSPQELPEKAEENDCVLVRPELDAWRWKDGGWKKVGPIAVFGPGESVLEPDIREELAAYAHEAWSGWMKYLFNTQNGTIAPNGRWIIGMKQEERWRRQMETPYADLPESEKESDRAEAYKMIEIMEKHLSDAYDRGYTDGYHSTYNEMKNEQT